MERGRKGWRVELVGALALHGLLFVVLPQVTTPRDRALTLRASSLLPPQLSRRAETEPPPRRTLTLMTGGWNEFDRRASDDIPGLPRAETLDERADAISSVLSVRESLARPARPATAPQPAKASEKPNPRESARPARAARPAEPESAREPLPPGPGKRLETAGRPEAAELQLREPAEAAGSATEKLQTSRAVAVAVAGGVPVLRGAAQLAVQALERRDEVPAGGGFGSTRGAASLAGTGRVQRLVQQRIDHIAELLGPSAVAQVGKAGEALVDLRVDALGYVDDANLVRSAGDPRLDEEIETIVHLGEPYPRFQGVMRVRVRFAR